MKNSYDFLSIIHKARLISKNDPRKYRVKKSFSNSVRNALTIAGWIVEGRISFPKGGECYGMTNGTEHITVTDSGKNSFGLGDTDIDVVLVPMTTFHQCPVELR